MAIRLFLLISWGLQKMYSYEGLNILFRFMPMSVVPQILRYYGANIGTNVRIKSPISFNDALHVNGYFYNLSIGSNTFIGRNSLIDLKDKVIIGENVTISHNVSIHTHTDAGNSPLKDTELLSCHLPVIINSGTYIGANVTILQGIEIGSNSIIGALSLVNKDVPPNTTSFGVPSKVIRINNYK
jgi:acetyltransferase-like isoleucine patch superfamily enzyme